MTARNKAPTHRRIGIAAILSLLFVCAPGTAQTARAADGEGIAFKRIPIQFIAAPGEPMPPVEGCRKQDYAVLFVIGIAIDG